MEKRKRRFRLSIRVKAIALIIIFGLIVVEVAMTFFSLEASKTNQAIYKKNADNLSATISSVVDVDDFVELKNKVKNLVDTYDQPLPIAEEVNHDSEEWHRYIDRFKVVSESETFKRTLAFLQRIEEANANTIDCAYLSYVDYDRKLCVYVIDAATEGACEPGSLDRLRDINYDVINDNSRGFPAYYTNTDAYGYLMSAGAPIKQGDDVVGYAFVDIPMNEVRKAQANKIITLFVYLISSIAAIIVVGIIAIHYLFYRPVKKLTDAANSYDISDPEGTHENFRKLSIRRRDELGDLCTAIKRMEGDVNYQINKLTETNKALLASQRQTKKMKELASSDPLTGAYSKIAYSEAVAKLNKEIANGVAEEFAIAMIDLNYLKETNDTNGHDAGDVALMKLSNLIKTIFRGHPVYRIGGDEFVAIVNKGSKAKMDKLVEKFNTELQAIGENEALADYERISAAIGYSVYQKGEDKNVDDVFKRADQAMYRRKRYMKENQ